MDGLQSWRGFCPTMRLFATFVTVQQGRGLLPTCSGVLLEEGGGVVHTNAVLPSGVHHVIFLDFFGDISQMCPLSGSMNRASPLRIRDHGSSYTHTTMQVPRPEYTIQGLLSIVGRYLLNMYCVVGNKNSLTRYEYIPRKSVVDKKTFCSAHPPPPARLSLFIPRSNGPIV